MDEKNDILENINKLKELLNKIENGFKYNHYSQDLNNYFKQIDQYSNLSKKTVEEITKHCLDKLRNN